MKRHQFAARTTVAVALLVPLFASAAEELTKSALDVVPDDAAFFASWSRQGEQLGRVLESKAFSEFMEIPQVQEVLGPLLFRKFDENNPNHVTLKQWLSQPFVQVGLDAVSHEVFVYGDVSFTHTLRQFQAAAAATRRVRLQALAAGKNTKEADEKAGLAAVKHLTAVRVPDMVFGFKVKDGLRAQSQLMLLDMLIPLTLAAKNVPPRVREAYDRTTVQGQRFLTFRLDGSMIPFERITFDEDATPEVVAALKKAMRKLEMSVAVGCLGDYVLVSIGDNMKHLERLGQVDALSGHPDLARLKEVSDKRLTSVYYVASAYRAAMVSDTGQLPELAELIRESVERDTGLSEKTRARVKEALAALKEEKLADPNTPPALVGLSFLTDDGYEGFRFGDVARGSPLDGPLSVLLHVGPDPIALSARRDWIGTVRDYIRFSDRLVLKIRQAEQVVDVGDNEAMRHFWHQVCDLAFRFDTILREQIVPALEGGQGAALISATDRARQWHSEMPAAEEPLPLPELGFVVETSDPEGLLEGVENAYVVVDEAIRLVTDAAQEIPPLKLEIEDTALGRLYYLPLWPDLTRIDPDLLAPTAGLSDRWLVLTLRPKTATALLRPTGWGPPDTSATEQNHLVTVRHIEPERLVQIIFDWIRYAEQTVMEDATEEDKALLVVYRGILRLAACMQSYTRLARQEDNVMVSHAVWQFQDRP